MGGVGAEDLFFHGVSNTDMFPKCNHLGNGLKMFCYRMFTELAFEVFFCSISGGAGDAAGSAGLEGEVVGGDFGGLFGRDAVKLFDADDSREFADSVLAVAKVLRPVVFHAEGRFAVFGLADEVGRLSLRSCRFA